MNDLNRPTEERLGWLYLPCLHSSVLQTAHQVCTTLYTEISIQMRSQTIWTKTTWRFKLRLVWLKQLWIFNCLWATPPIHECLAEPEDTVLEDEGSCFLHIHPTICSEHQEEQGLLMTFSSDSLSLANPKGITRLPKATSNMFIMVWHFFSGKRHDCHDPPKLTIINLNTTPSFGISFKSYEMINKIPTFTL